MKHTTLAIGALSITLAPAFSLAEQLTEAAMRTKLQMAATLDVDPEAYTLNELAQINCIVDSDDSEYDSD